MLKSAGEREVERAKKKKKIQFIPAAVASAALEENIITSAFSLTALTRSRTE